MKDSAPSTKKQIWLTITSFAVVAIIIYLFSLTFPTSKTGACSPTATPVIGARGVAGMSAYELWLAEGNSGTKAEFLAALVGTKGDRGYRGSNGLTGPAGADGSDGANGADGSDGSNGTDGSNGSNGVDGKDGKDGASAYQLWLDAGNTGTADDFLKSLVGGVGAAGVDGVDGLSAYELWLSNGNTGSESDFLASLKGEPGVCTVVTSGAGLPYNGSFYDTTTQLNTSRPNLMRYNNTDPWTNGIHVNSTNNSRIYLEHDGVYNIQFSTQFAKTDSGTDYIDIWLRKNGNNVPMTDTELRSWGNDDRQVAAWNFFVEAKAGDYYEIAWQSLDANIKMLSTADNSIPGIPSVILTVTQVR